MNRNQILTFLILLSGILSCKKDSAEIKTSNIPKTDTSSLIVEQVEENHYNIGRAIWQKPGLVIEKLGDISDKVIADIGAGSGYFSFRLAPRAKKVIAIEIEPELLTYLDSLKIKLPADKRKNLETRLAYQDNPNLSLEEADIILIINTIAYIHDLPTYLQTLKKGLKKEGIIMVIDYKMKNLPINAPPKTERIYLDQLENMFIDAGYQIIETDDTSLDYQYIIKAQKI